jgi:hypothetical protein
VQAVRDFGYVVQNIDKQNGTIAFRTGISWRSFGQDVQLVLVEGVDGSYSFDMTHSYEALTDWGEGKLIARRIKERTVQILESKGLRDVRF